MATSKTTDSGDFTADVLQSDKPVLLDFGLNGVAHARRLVLRLKKSLVKTIDSLSIVKLNIDVKTR